MSIGAPQYRDVNSETLSATKTLAVNDAYIQRLDPGGAGRNVDLPAEAQGLQVYIVNTADAAEDLTVREDSGATTIVTVSQNEDAYLFCDGTDWQGNVSDTT